MNTTTKNKEAVNGLLVGTAETPNRAASVADFFGKCPYCARSLRVGKLVLVLLSFPKSRKWWFETIAEDPVGTIGLCAAQVLYPKNLSATSPWSSGRTDYVAATPPCGADCSTYNVYQDRCPGCPATTFFQTGYESRRK